MGTNAYKMHSVTQTACSWDSAHPTWSPWALSHVDVMCMTAKRITTEGDEAPSSRHSVSRKQCCRVQVAH